MSILDLGNGPSRPAVGKKSTRIFIGFGLLVAVIGIGSTFASTISINANQDIEFGQGVERSVFCGGDAKITVTPASTFANSEELGTFGLTSITVSDIPADCSDRDFVLKVYDNETALPLLLSHTSEDSMSIANVWWANGCPEDEDGCRVAGLEEGYALVSTSLDGFSLPDNIALIDNTPTSFTVSFLSNPLSSDDVKKIVVETQNDKYGYDQWQCIEFQRCVVTS